MAIKNTHWTNEKIAEIHKRYNTGESMESIGRDYSLSRTGLRKLLLRTDVQLRDFKRLWDENVLKVITTRYSQGEPINHLADEFGIPCSTLYRKFDELDVVRRTQSEASRGYDLDENVFDKLTETTAYWIGFLSADGAICGNRISLQLAVKDRAHLEKFRDFFQSTHPITYRKPCGFEGATGSYRVDFRSDKLVKRLLEFGVGERKSLTLEPAEHLKEIKGYWNGLIDGDGWLREQRATIGLTGSLAICNGFRDFCGRHVDVSANSIGRNGSVWKFTLTDRKGRHMIRELYQKPPVFLDRKMEIAQRIMALQ